MTEPTEPVKPSTPAPELSKPAGGTTTTERASSFSLDIERRDPRTAVLSWWSKVRSGEPGAVPSVLGLIVLAVIFSAVSSRFLSKANIGNLPGQGAYIAIIGLGLVFVLLLGEIDLSAGTVGGMTAGFAGQSILSGGLKKGEPGLLFWSVMAFLAVSLLLGLYLKSITGPIVVAIGMIIGLTPLGQHVVFALILAVAFGTSVGIVTGWLVAKIGIPSFIVTLAMFLAWQGVLNFAVNAQPVGINGYSFWYGLSHNNMSVAWSWVFAIVLVVLFFGFTALKSVRAQAKGLAADTIELVVLRSVGVAVLALGITFFLNRNRSNVPGVSTEGVPWALSIPIAIMVVCTIALTKTTWGRHLFATGGSEEAARRAGIDVVHIKVTAFTICSAFGALGGVFLASETGAVSLDLGAGNVLLFSVAAAVIGGTSLFGGRGKPRDAIIGALVIVMIPNGLGLRPSLPAAYQNVITGLVLLIAAAVDALSRRRSRSAR